MGFEIAGCFSFVDGVVSRLITFVRRAGVRYVMMVHGMSGGDGALVEKLVLEGSLVAFDSCLTRQDVRFESYSVNITFTSSRWCNLSWKSWRTLEKSTMLVEEITAGTREISLD